MWGQDYDNTRGSGGPSAGRERWCGVGDDQQEISRSDMVTVRQALRQDWEIAPEIREKILARLTAYVVADAPDGKPENRPRIVLAAARTVAMFARLAMAQQALDAKEASPDENEISIRRGLEEAERLCGDDQVAGG